MAGLNNSFLPRAVLETLGFAALGDDVLIHPTVVIVDCSKIAIGSRVRIDPYVILSNRGGIVFGNNIHIGGHSSVSGAREVRFGDFVNISHHVDIYTTSDDTSGRTLSHPTAHGVASGARNAGIVFERHAIVGAGSVVLPGARFGEGAVLGALSRTGRPLKPWTTYEGIPARRRGERRKDVLAAEEAYLASLAR